MFLADIMLAKVARWLRILGFSADTPDLKSDGEFLEYAKGKGLVLLTMDIELHERARKQRLRAFLVPKKGLEEQVASILKEFSLELKEFPSKTICPKCNGSLEVVSKELVRDKVHEKTFKAKNDFWQCKECGHVFWEGSHWERINSSIKRIRSYME